MNKSVALLICLTLGTLMACSSYDSKLVKSPKDNNENARCRIAMNGYDYRSPSFSNGYQPEVNLSDHNSINSRFVECDFGR